VKIKIIVVSLMMVALTTLYGCATQQETTDANQAAAPVIHEVQNVVSLTQATLNSAGSTVNLATNLQKQVPTELQPAASAVVNSAQTTLHDAQAANTAAQSAAKTANNLPRQIVGAEKASASAAAAKVRSGLIYKLGLLVFLLLVVGLLIWFSESGWADSLGVKFPVLATLVFYPFHYVGLGLGCVWGWIEKNLAWLWGRITNLFSSSSATPAS